MIRGNFFVSIQIAADFFVSTRGSMPFVGLKEPGDERTKIKR